MDAMIADLRLTERLAEYREFARLVECHIDELPVR